MSTIVSLFVSSILLAGLYAVTSAGLGLIYGVLRIVNLAHGGFILLGAYVAMTLTKVLHVDPLITLVLIGPLGFLSGYGLYHLLVRRLKHDNTGRLQGLLMLFAVWLIMQNIVYVAWGPGDRSIRASYSLSSVDILGVTISVGRLAVLGVSAIVLCGVYLWLEKTKFGHATRAVAQNRISARLVGINDERVFAVSFGIGAALASIAGTLGAIVAAFSPTFGTPQLLVSFVVVILAGLGSFGGIVGAALIVAMAETFSILFVAPFLSDAVGFVILVGILFIRPRGLFAKSWVAR